MMIDWLKKWAQETPDKCFITDYYDAESSQDYSFRDTYNMVKTREKLYAGPLKKEQRVALLADNSFAFFTLLYSLLLLKKEVLLLNTQLSLYEIENQAQELGIQTIFVAPELQEKIKNSTQPTLYWNSSRLSNQTASELPNRSYKSENIAVIMNTSATTGKFKSVPITWKMLDAHVKASAATIGVLPEDNWLVVLPMFHVSGLSIIMRTLYNGTHATILPHFDENLVLDLVSAGKINMMSLVPTMLKRLIDRLERHRLRMILLGGEFIPQPLITASRTKNLPIYKTYGMTETFSQSVTFNILDFPEKIASVGKALPGVKISIKNPDTTGAGEIWLDSPMLMDGYLGRSPLLDGFETGDIGRLDADGFLYVLNRRRDIIISGGENIYPKEIENLLYELPEIRECAVVPRSDSIWGQIPILYFSSDGASKFDETVKSYLTEKLAKYKLPHEFIRLDELPKNASGKILRKELK